MLDINGMIYANDFDVPPKIARSSAVGGKLKRIFDVVFSLVALVGVAPLFLVIMAMIRSNSKGSIFFVHNRIGFKGQVFPCLKFRTMMVDADEQLRRVLETDRDLQQEFAFCQKLKLDPRIVPGIGVFLRKTSLDELPQFINVLLGHMSVVGPRPVTKEELPKYGKAVNDYLSVRPGITGLWQVSGRNDLSFDQRVQIDQKYVWEWSLTKDFRIMLRTIDVMFMRRGAY